MTLCMAWKRVVDQTTELVIATDSRLRFGCAWDCGPKVLAMPRSDLAICFAGETLYAYPLMLHLSFAIGQHSKSRSRATDISDLKGHASRVFDGLAVLLSDFPRGKDSADPPNVWFILGGFSWKKKSFVMWKIKYEHKKGKHLECALREFNRLHQRLSPIWERSVRALSSCQLLMNRQVTH